MKPLRQLAAFALTTVTLLIASAPVPAQQRVLFDASHRENAGNADWVIDADRHDQSQPHYPCGPSDIENESEAQRHPTPDASGISAVTVETYWTGALSAFGVDLVKLGYVVEVLPVGADITFGDPGNPQDLAGYDVLVLPEPNRPFDVAETLAIRDFVAAGGGLFLITDHQTSDRDCDGHDSPHIGNDLMGVEIDGGAIVDHGLFGIVFNVEEISGQTGADYWFTEAVNDNVSTDPGDPIVDGPHGSGTGGLGLFGATAMTLDPETNASVRGHVWKADAGGQGTTRVTFATASYLDGRIACIGDSSPADDGTGDPNDTLYPGWDKASGGVDNREIHLNAVAWLAGPDADPPAITSGPDVEAFDCSARITWTTDEAADSVVDYGPDASYGWSTGDGVLTTSHFVMLTDLVPNGIYHFRVSSTDASGNGPTSSTDDVFGTTAAAAPTIVSGPSVTQITGESATVIWSTDEPTDSLVRFGPTAGYGDSESDPALVTEHAVTLGALVPSSTYHFSVESADACGNGPASSTDDAFTTSPAQVDISGWTLLQYESTQSFVFPQGTTIPGGGYLVLAREASQTAFETEWGPLPVGTVFVTSGGIFPFINGGESFELRDDEAARVDGVTISMSAATTLQRNNPGDPPADPGSWTVAGAAAGSPGSGAGLASGAGVTINEASDASDFRNEFVELFLDAVPAGLDTTAPATVNDLIAEPRSGTVIRLSWTAPGDDGNTGTATLYDARVAARPLLSEADFASATELPDEPSPTSAGLTQQWDVDGLSPTTTYYFSLRTLDEVGNASAPSGDAGATTGALGSGTGGTVADHPVISEIRTRGVSDHDDEFIELYNPTGFPVALDGWSVQYRSATGSTFSRFDLPPGAIPPGGFYLLTRPAGDYSGSVPGDATYGSFLMSASGGHVFLVDSDTTLSSCTGAGIVDKIGYGTANCPEGGVAATHAAGESLERSPGEADPSCGNGSDTDDNASDFAIRTAPDPQNGSTLEPPCRDLGPVGASLFLGGTGRDDLRWGAALGATGYKLRRSPAPDFMQTDPVPDDTHLLDTTTTPSYTDPTPPPAGTVFHYFVTALNPTTESPN